MFVLAVFSYFMLGNEFTDFWNKLGRDIHDRLINSFNCRLIFCQGLFLSLRFIMRENLLDPFLVPSWRELTLFHFLFLRRRRL